VLIPNTRVHLESQQAIIAVDGQDVLNIGHDPVLHILQNAAASVTLVVGRPPPNESPMDYIEGAPPSVRCHAAYVQFAKPSVPLLCFWGICGTVVSGVCRFGF
jgi:hypothetical protein